MLQHVIVTAAPVLLWLIGLPWLIRELLRRTATETAFCGKCGYNLTGLTSDRCPECGRHLRWGGAVYGQRRPRYRRVAVAGLLLLAGGGLFTVRLSQAFWRLRIEDFLPNGVFLDRFASPNSAVRNAAADELRARRLRGRLTPAEVQRQADIALARLTASAAATSAPGPATTQVTPTVVTAGARSDLWLLSELASAGQLTLPQTVRLGQLVFEKFELQMPARSRVGTPTPLRVGFRLTPVAFDALSVYTVGLACDALLVDGQPQNVPVEVLQAWEWNNPQRTSGKLSFEKPGMHTVTVRFGPANRRQSLLGAWRPEVSATIQVDSAEVGPETKPSGGE